MKKKCMTLENEKNITENPFISKTEKQRMYNCLIKKSTKK